LHCTIDFSSTVNMDEGPDSDRAFRVSSSLFKTSAVTFLRFFLLESLRSTDFIGTQEELLAVAERLGAEERAEGI
jgi:hypothetical protein